MTHESSSPTEVRNQERQRSLNRSVARILLAFSVISAVWVVAGDRLLAAMVSDPKALVEAQVWKDIAFLLVAAVTMGWMVRHELVRYAQSRDAILSSQDMAMENERRYRMIFDQSPLPMWIYAQETRRVLAVNDAAIQQYGYSRKEWMKLSINDLRPKEELPRLEKAVKHVHGHLHYGGESWTHVKKDGSLIEVDIASDELSFQGLRARLVIARDVTAHHQAEERSYRLAYFDPLTGLHNRYGLLDYLSGVVVNATAAPFALLLLDLDHFRDVNDTLGHAAGDQVLTEVARRLRGALPEPVTMARISADIFAVVYDTHDGSDARALTERLTALVAEPIVLQDGRVLSMTACAGIVLAPEHGKDRDTLMRHAEATLHGAITEGAGTVALFRPALESIA
jgi:diguanylate cyclase (GGDEF)-like protein/PAS domain S-box-containing protein